MFRNAEGRTFRDVTTAGNFGHLQEGHAVCFADVDELEGVKTNRRAMGARVKVVLGTGSETRATRHRYHVREEGEARATQVGIPSR